MEMSATIGALAKALSQAQAKFPAIIKDKEVEVRGKAVYKFKYAELEQIIDKTRPVLAEFGLSVSQLVGEATLCTILMHESGEYIKEYAEIPRGAYDQQVGAAITYRRRYAQVAILNISAEDDNDGGDIEGTDKEVRGGRAEVARVTQEQLKELNDLIGTKVMLNKVLDAYGIETLRDLPAEEFDNCKKRLLARGK